MNRFYVVQTQPQRERLAVNELRNQNFQTFFPVIKHLPRISRGRLDASRTSPLFPKYLFVSLDLELDRWRSINGTRGVTRIICMDEDRPSPVAQSIMDRLLASGEVIEERAAGLPFDVNDLVEFTDGPMKGIQGIVSLCATDRVSLLMDMLGGKVSVHAKPSVLKYVAKSVA